MPSGAVKPRFSIHSKSVVICFVIYCGFHHHHLHASFAVKLTFANKYVMCQKYPSMHNPNSLQMQHQYFKIGTVVPNLGMNTLSGAGREKVGYPDHVWILGG